MIDIKKNILDTTRYELINLFSYKNDVLLYKYLCSICSKKIYAIKQDSNKYTVCSLLSYECQEIFGQNMFIVILPLEGIVYSTTYDIVEKTSGLSMWLTNEKLQSSIIQYDMYNPIISYTSIKSPYIILSDLPSQSLTLHKNTPPNTNDSDVVTIYDLIHFKTPY